MKQSKELEVVELMIRLYCRKKHKCKYGLCTECNELLGYVKLRRSKCPWGDKKHAGEDKECHAFFGTANDFISSCNSSKAPY